MEVSQHSKYFCHFCGKVRRLKSKWEITSCIKVNQPNSGACWEAPLVAGRGGVGFSCGFWRKQQRPGVLRPEFDAL